MSEEVLKELERLGAHKVFKRMARNDQLLVVRCEMPRCYCPKGRKYFNLRSQAKNWQISFDHYPQLAMHKGPERESNARIGHIECNNVDYGWRSRIGPMMDRGMSLQEIADELKRKKVKSFHGTNEWTPASVRKAQIS